MANLFNISLPIDERNGQIGFNKDGDKMQIIVYNGYDNIIVRFMDNWKCEVKTQYVNFIRGNVKNYNKVIYGNHGFLGQGPYTSEHKDKNGKRIIHNEYSIWKNMHERAGNFDGMHPSYVDVTVCEEWWNYQNFAKWYNDHKYEIKGDFLCLDKDILNPTGRVYSPENCCLVPNTINEVFKDFVNYKRDGLPIGVTRRNDSKSIKYRARTTTVDETGRIVYKNKTFDNVLDAFNYYKECKEKYIKFLAEKYKNVIEEKVYKKLIEYEVTTKYDFNI